MNLTIFLVLLQLQLLAWRQSGMLAAAEANCRKQSRLILRRVETDTSLSPQQKYNLLMACKAYQTRALQIQLMRLHDPGG